MICDLHCICYPGIVTASVVSVESPLQADLPFLNNIGVSSAVAASPSDIDRAEYVLSNSSYLSADSAAAPPPAVVGSGCDNGGVAPSSNAATAPSAFVPPTPTSTPLETGMRSAPPPLLQAQDPPVRSAVVRLESTVWSASCCSEEEGKEALSAGYVTVPSDTASSCGGSSADGAIRKTGLKGDDTQDQSPVGVDRGLRRCIKVGFSILSV